MLCLVLEWPLLCAVPVSSVPSRKPPLLLEALPIFCLSQLFPDEEACFFCSCVWPDDPMGSLSQDHPCNARLCVGRSDPSQTRGKKMENVVSQLKDSCVRVRFLLLVKPLGSPSLVPYK